MSKNLNSSKFDKIIISGGNGFTGRYLCKYLISRGLKFSVILRPGTNSDWMVKNQIPIIYFDLYQINQNLKVLKNFDCFINIASIGFGLCKHIIEACEMVSIKRVIFISSTSIFTSLNARSKKLELRLKIS